MSFKFVPHADYQVGQKIVVNGQGMTIVRRSAAPGRNFIAEADDGRCYVLVVADSTPVVEVSAPDYNPADLKGYPIVKTC